MIHQTSIDPQEALRCLLCGEPPCSAACPHGMDPGGLLRSLRFDNEVGAAGRLLDTDVCANCPALCREACVLTKRPTEIKHVLAALRADGTTMEILPPRPSLNSSFCDVPLENPFLLSSSVVASGYEMIARAFSMGWAGAAYKTICDFIPREASPRFSVLRESGHSFYGFKNIEQLSVHSLEEDLDILSRLKRDWPTKVLIASIMGRDEAEWTRLARLCAQAGADLIECNFSCPNMEQGGLGADVGQNPDLVRRYTAATRAGCGIPVLAKLTPNVGDMVPIAMAAKAGGADGLAAINTVKSIVGMNLDTYATAPSVRGLSGVGGYSGKAVKPIALRFVWELAGAEALGLPISGMGGIETWRDAAEFLLLGAGCLQVTTAVMQYSYRVIDDLLDGLSAYMAEKGFRRVEELVGLGVGNVAGLDDLERASIQYPRFARERCVGCSRCALSCRDGGHAAIEMKNRRPILKAKACVGCHLCVAVCPMDAIRPGKRISEGRAWN